MNCYKALNKQEFSNGNFSIVPIRFEDRFAIMKWRNEQLYHLRQKQPLTIEDQDNYFANIVSKIFDTAQPSQILFSFLEDGLCIGYGGLVHINWTDKNAEISFIMDTTLETNRFREIWSAYLSLLEQMAFEYLNFHKIYTYAFDLRPHLYVALLSAGFIEEARLKEHCYFKGKFLDVVYHCKFNRSISYRMANENDMMLYFEWANDVSVRDNSYQSALISLQNHKIWFMNKIKDKDYFMTVFQNHIGIPIGQVRIQKINKISAIIGISNDKAHRGKGYASKMIQIASDTFLKDNPQMCLNAYIKLENKASEKVFEKAGYKLKEVLEYDSIQSFHYIKKL